MSLFPPPPNAPSFTGEHQMVEFVSNYRRAPNINGKLSYSNLYTSISVLAGHYASYGPKFPVPEKRRKRLLQVGISVRTFFIQRSGLVKRVWASPL